MAQKLSKKAKAAKKARDKRTAMTSRRRSTFSFVTRLIWQDQYHGATTVFEYTPKSRNWDSKALLQSFG